MIEKTFEIFWELPKGWSHCTILGDFDSGMGNGSAVLQLLWFPPRKLSHISACATTYQGRGCSHYFLTGDLAARADEMDICIR